MVHHMILPQTRSEVIEQLSQNLLFADWLGQHTQTLFQLLVVANLLQTYHQ